MREAFLSALFFSTLFIVEEVLQTHFIVAVGLLLALGFFRFTNRVHLFKASLVLLVLLLCQTVCYKISFLKWWPMNLASLAALFYLILRFGFGFRFHTQWKLKFSSFEIVSLLAAVVLSTVGMWIYFMFNTFDPAKIPIRGLSEAQVYPALIIGSLVNSLREELPFRLLLLSSLTSLIGPVPANLVQAALFGAMHFHAGFTNGWMGLVMTFILGLILGFQTLKTRSIATAIATHAIVDVILLLIIKAKYLPPGFFQIP